MPADDLALFTHRLDRRTYLHGPFRLDDPDGEALETGAAAATIPGNGGGTPEPRGSRARPSRIAKGFVRSRRCLAAVSLALVALTAAPTAGADPLADHAPVLVHDSDERNPLASVARAGVAARAPRIYGRVAGSVAAVLVVLRAELAGPRGLEDRAPRRRLGDGAGAARGGRPVEAVYAQHSGAERCGWDDVTLDSGHPVVFVAERLARVVLRSRCEGPVLAGPERRGRRGRRDGAAPARGDHLALAGVDAVRRPVGRRTGGLGPGRGRFAARAGVPASGPVERSVRLGTGRSGVHARTVCVRGGVRRG